MNFGFCINWFCSKNSEDNKSTSCIANNDDDEQSTKILEPQQTGPNIPAAPCEDIIPPPKNCFRLVVLGSSKTGKSCIVSRFLGGKFHDSYTPTIEDFHRKLYRIRGEIYQLDILDTSGNHPFPAMRRLSFMTGDLFVIVFSMDSRQTYEEAIRLRDQIIETKTSSRTSSSNVGLTKKKNQIKIPMILAGNKCDKEMKTVTTDEAQSYCDTQDSCCEFVETSAKKNFQVDKIFFQLFSVANLPSEMAPNHHKRISATFGAPCPLPPPNPANYSKKYHLSVKRRLSDACGVVTPNVRRPSIRTDLMLMRSKTHYFVGGSAKKKNNSNPNSPLKNWGNKSDNNNSCTLQ